METWSHVVGIAAAIGRSLDVNALFMIGALLIGVRAFTRTVAAGPTEFWHFYSSHAVDPDGSVVYYGDPEKLGILIGIFASTMFMGLVLYFQPVNNWYVVVMFAIWLLFISGSSAFAKWGRGFLDRWLSKKTEREPEPPKAPQPAPVVANMSLSVPPQQVNKME